MIGDSDTLAESNVQQNIDPVVSTTGGGQQQCASCNMESPGHTSIREHRIDGAHDSPPTYRPRSPHRPRSTHAGIEADRDRRNAPRRRPSFGMRLRNATSRSQSQSIVLAGEESQHDLCETLVAYDVGGFQVVGLGKSAGFVRADFESSALGNAAVSKNHDGDSQRVERDPLPRSGEADHRSGEADHSEGFDDRATESKCVAGVEDWLSAHSADLIRRIQSWSDELSARESMLKVRISRQEQRERRFRESCEASLVQAEESARQGR